MSCIKILKDLNKRNIKFQLKKDEITGKYTNFKIGGQSLGYIVPNKIEDFSKIVKYFTNKEINHFVIGKGTNCIFNDKGYNGYVIELPEDTKKMSLLNKRLVVGAKVDISNMVQHLEDNEIFMFEYIINKPGSIGAALHSKNKKLTKHLDYIVAMNKEGNIGFINYENINSLEDSIYILTANFKIDTYKEMAQEKVNYKGYLKNAVKLFDIKKDRWRDMIETDKSYNDIFIPKDYPGIIMNKGAATYKDVKDVIKYLNKNIKEKNIKKYEVKLVG